MRRARVCWFGAALLFTVYGCTLSSEGTRFDGAGGGVASSSSSGTGAGGGGTSSGTGGTSSGTSSGTGGTSSGTGGSSSGTGGSSGEGGTTSSGTGGEGGSVLVELDCLNGEDDDGDGSIDCDDSDCQAAGYSCLAPAAGALGHVVVTGSCPAATQPKVLRSCDAGACACGGSDGNCTLSVYRWNGGDCDGPSDSSEKISAGCYYVTTTDSSFRGTAAPTGNSACPMVAANVAAEEVSGCEVLGGSCSGGGACVPPGFPTPQACVLLPEGSSCAAPYDGFRQVVYDDPASTCACSCSKSGATCEGDVWAYAGVGCGGTPSAVAPIDGQCHPVGSTQYYYIWPVIEHPTCDASATMASGAATLCCTQPL